MTVDIVKNLIEISVEESVIHLELTTETACVVDVGTLIGTFHIHDSHYTHIQSVASNLWVINHNLGKYPAVTVVDSGGTEWLADIQHNSLNQCTAHFSAPFTGNAYCN